MKAVTISSLMLAFLFAAVATGVCYWRMPAMYSGEALISQGVVLSGLLFVAAVACLLPVGLIMGNAMGRLIGHIDGCGNDEVCQAAPPLPAPLRPVLRAFTGTVDRCNQREQQLRGQLRDLEIKHRVSEAQRRQIEAVLHSLRDPVFVTDAYCDIVMVNEAAARMLGFEVSDAIHKPVSEIVSDQRLAQLISDAREHANFSERRHVAFERTDAEGNSRAYDLILTCVENHKKEVGGVVAILHDLTREREISQMKSDFVSKASHELRTPLSSIRAYIEMLVDGEAQDEESRQEFFRIIQSETDRLGRLIDNMLNISRIEAGIVQIERETTDFKTVIARAVETLEPQAKEKDISLSSKLSPIDLTVEGDPDMLFQVVLNLMSNAVKYTPEGGRVTVSADSDNLTRSVLVSINDTGLGIPPDSLPKLFDKFYRVENYKRVAKGTGLGLNLCKHIVETLHHGQIGVESELGMGSRFWFSVPMRYAGSSRAA